MICPIEVRKRHEKAQGRRERAKEQVLIAPLVLSKGDPLFDVLEESQVGLDPISRRPKITKEVLDEMWRYLLADTGEDRTVKIDRLRSTVKKAEVDPRAQRSVLRLEPAPIVIKDVNKGKGLVFDYGEKVQKKVDFDLNVNPTKLMAVFSKRSNSQLTLRGPVVGIETSDESSLASDQRSFSGIPTVFHMFFGARNFRDYQ